jgi:hypothetical protein
VSDTCQNWKPNTFAYFLSGKRIVNQAMRLNQQSGS